jgi:predicted regulator of Ras-like GTPase activity (Roadblock/LC7/MglB family)
MEQSPPTPPGGGSPPAPKWGKDDQSLRDAQLSFFKGDVSRLDAVLKALLKSSEAKCAFLITTGGHMVTSQGDTAKLDTDTIAALVSGAFAATKKLFEVFNEPHFAMTVQKGKHESFYIGMVGPKTMITVLFDEKTNQGKVQLYATEATKRLEVIYTDIAEGRGAKPGEDEKLADDFGKSAGGALDNILG